MKRTHRALSSITLNLLLCSLMTEVRADGYVHQPELWHGAYWGLSFGAGLAKTNNYAFFSNTAITTTRNNIGTITTSFENSTINEGAAKDNAAMQQAEFLIGYNVHQPNSKLLFGGQLEGSIFNSFDSIPYIRTSGETRLVDYINPNRNRTVPDTGAQGNFSLTIDSIISLIGRVGILYKEDNLIYGLVGPTEAKYSLFSDKKWKLGITSGAGFEHKFNEHWSVAAEYRFTRLTFKADNNQDVINTGIGNPPLGATVTNTKIIDVAKRDLNLNMANFAVIYRI